MARHPRPLDPEDGPVSVFALELRTLRHRMGPTAPTIDQISEKQEIPRSTLYAAMSGTRIPTEDVLAALVRAWGGDPAEWMVKRAGVVQAIGLQRLRAEKVGTIHINQSTPTLSQEVIDYLEAQTLQERKNQKRPTDRMISFGGDLKRTRIEALLTQSTVAQALGLSQATLSRIELGHVLPNWSTLKELLRALVPPSEYQAAADKWKTRREQVQSEAALERQQTARS